MKRTLKDISRIQPGFSFRGRIEPQTSGDVRVVQIKDIGGDGKLLTADLIRTEAANLRPEYLVRQGDVLFTTRGLSRRAAFVRESLDATMYVAQIFAVRDLEPGIEPEYLTWYLNQTPAQDFLDTYSTGAFIQNIRRDVFENLPVSVPSIETQKMIVEIDQLRQRESQLRAAIKEKRDQLVEKTLLTAIDGKRQ